MSHLSTGRSTLWAPSC